MGFSKLSHKQFILNQVEPSQSTLQEINTMLSLLNMMKIGTGIAYALIFCIYPVSTFQLVVNNHRRRHPYRPKVKSPAATTAGAAAAGNAVTNDKLKDTLTQAIIEFRKLKDRDGNLSIDFGVKGGELNSVRDLRGCIRINEILG